MFGWFARKTPDNDCYAGEGTFLGCPSCGGYHRAPDIPAFEAAMEEACAQVSDSTDRLYEAFNIGAPDGRWDMVPADGVFWFTQSCGRRCYAQFSLVGSWIEDTHSWMWGWHLPDSHITDATRKAPDLARAAGAAHGWVCLTTPTLLLDDAGAWHMTKYAARCAGHPLVYRAKVNDRAWAYFAMDTPVWES
ncbi:MAG: DUF6882 domain-containing protein [Pseudomonadota bacterium]